jgi:hypothetical protein
MGFVKPEGIPKKLWEAESTLEIACLPVGGRELVCRAILAERERCADIARNASGSEEAYRAIIDEDDVA